MHASIACSGVMPGEAILDRAHLARMTLSDRALEREVLALFDRQSELLLARIRVNFEDTPDLAHTLKGSACGIGAFAVAHAAEALERADKAAHDGLIEALAAAIGEARAAIAEVLSVERASAAA